MEKLLKFSKKSIEEIFNELQTSKDGLAQNASQDRLKIYGPNEIISFKIDLLEIIKRNSLNFFNFFLFFAGLLSFLIKGPEIETILIFFFLFLSIFIAVLQDYRINKLSEKLLSYFENYAYVKRNGKWQRINAKEIVPGDYIRVSAGYLIPADLRILKAEDALVDESIITGESEPIPKSPQINADITRIDADKKAQLNPDSQSIIPKNIALMGTTLIKGEIEGIVFATGKESYLGSVAKKTLEIEKETAYQKMMTDFAKNIGILSIFIAFIVILINLLKPNYPNFQELIIFAIVLTVAIVPEFLPTMTVLALSLAGNRLAKRGLIIKRLSAIEDLGAIEILCTDKTGTITTNQLKLGKIISENQDEFIKYFLADYYLTQEITPYEKAIMEKNASGMSTDIPRINADLEGINTDITRRGADNPRISASDPRESVENLRESVGDESASDQWRNFELIKDTGFDPIKRIRKIIVKENGREIEIIKGAPENVLEYLFPRMGTDAPQMNADSPRINADLEGINTDITRRGADNPRISASDPRESVVSESVEDPRKSVVDHWLKVFEEEDKNGYRTLALGIKTDKGVKFLGIASFFDPLKETAFSAMKLAKSLNLEIKILTGDSLNVARKVALELGLIGKDEKVISGEEIRNLSDNEVEKIIKATKVFARVLPEDKLRIIKILQKERFVGFLGEGINDAPALKIANVALAVDNATDVVKQEADIILKEKDLNTIVEGIYNGRKVLENIGKYIKHTMSDNFGNLTSVAILSSILPFVPMTPLQVLLTNFLTDIPLVAFANDDVAIKEVKKPLKMSEKHLIFLLLSLGIVAGIINIWGYLIVKNEPVETIRTYIFFLTTMTGLLVSFLIRTKNWFIFSKPPKSFTLASGSGLILTLIFIFIPPFKEIFDFSYLNSKLLIYSLFLMIIFIVGTEISKKLFYKKFPDVI